MKYKDMHELIRKSCGCREFFLAQPFYVQIELHKLNSKIHTREQLMSAVENLQYIAKKL